ncbi:MAG TPA: 4-alpha-glucanotransferase [Candidatus Atribacteria bacterium]|nr:4-alpha-glucanotransferase [Candidatus Atribacteria bacterium]
MGNREEKVKELSQLLGIQLFYYDIKGKKVETSLSTLLALLQVMGVEDLSEKGLEEKIREKEEEKNNPFPPVIVTKERKLCLGPLPPQKVVLVVKGEKGEEWREEFKIEEYSLLEWNFPPSMEWGYYELTFLLGGEESVHSVFLVFSPGSCFVPSHNLWGIQVPVFSLATERSQGIGDWQDLLLIEDKLKKAGGSFLGVLPLHLTENRAPYGISPYLPLDRMLWNPIYLPLEEVASFHGYEEGKQYLAELSPHFPSWEQEIDYDKVWSLKQKFLRKIFHLFFKKRNEDPRFSELESFFQEERIRLTSFFYAFAEDHGFSWKNWPSSYRYKEKRAIEDYIQAHQERVLYHAYLQWLMENLLSSGSYLGFDLPVGASSVGSECFLAEDCFAFGALLGAPPDDFAPAGQNWGFPPPFPEKERKSGYRHFIALIRKNMQFARYLRVDHILGWQRLFWIPEGSEAQEGAYVRNFLSDLLGIVALESVRQEVTVIGEDLGTVDPILKENLSQFQVLSTRVFYFEKDSQGFPLPPSHYPYLSLATFNTHDLPPLFSFWEGEDISLRKKIGIYEEEEAQAYFRERKEFQEKVLQKFSEWGLWKEEGDLWETFLHFLALTPSLIKVVGLNDVLGEKKIINLPGTIDEYPNWRLRVFIQETNLEDALYKIGKIMRER